MASAVDFEIVLLRTLREDAGLSALVGNKVFALVIPQGTKLPCITFQRLGREARQHAVRGVRSGGNRPSDRRVGTGL